MPEDDELEPEHETLPPDVQALLRQGRKAQRDLEAASIANAAMERQIAFEKAGIPDSPQRELLMKAYDGPADAEAIKAEAERYGLFSTPAPASSDSGPSTAEFEAQRQILSAGGGAPAISGDIDLAVALRNAKSQAEVLEIVAQVAGTPGFRTRDGLIGVLPEPI